MKNIYFIFILCLFYACKNDIKDSPIKLFSNQEDLFEFKCWFNEDSLALIEGVQSNNSSLIVFDYHSGNSFTIFDLQQEKCIGRFGTIGQGPGEIPLGCYGYLNDSNFAIYYYTGLIAKYPVDSLRTNIHFKPLRLAKYEIAETQFSCIIPVNDSLFLGAGVYQSKFQFALFNEKNEVIDVNLEIYNAKDDNFNKFQKDLSNQGRFQKHPNQNKFVYTVNNSSNIDFVEVLDDKIVCIKSIRLRDPKNIPLQNGDWNSVLPDKNNPIGYIDISTSNKYVYTLYTDKKLVKDNGEGNSFSSDIILKFDWDGNPVKILRLPQEAYYITVNEKFKKIYAAIKNEDKGWNITSFELDNP
jgi:hypothetical protein